MNLRRRCSHLSVSQVFHHAGESCRLPHSGADAGTLWSQDLRLFGVLSYYCRVAAAAATAACKLLVVLLVVAAKPPFVPEPRCHQCFAPHVPAAHPHHCRDKTFITYLDMSWW